MTTADFGGFLWMKKGLFELETDAGGRQKMRSAEGGTPAHYKPGIASAPFPRLA